MRLLVVAPGASRDAVGETQIAYQWLHRLSDRHEVTLLTSYSPGRPVAAEYPKARVIEWQDPAVFGRFERFNAMLKPGYVLFARRARQWISSALKRGDRFDVGHQLVPVSMRYASPLAGTGIPYVIGPVGGSLPSPPGFAAEEGGAQWFTALRRLDGFRLRYDPALRRTYRDAACVVGIADYVRETLGDVPVRDFRVLGDVGITELPEAAAGSQRAEGVRFLFVGRVIRTKGVRDAIRALSLLPHGLAVLDVVGAGYDDDACRDLAAELGVGDLVRFHGWVPHERALSFYSDADVFLFPSYREAGGIAVVEALSYGLPAIVCDRGGPASTVDEHSGVRIPAHEPAQYARDIAEAMRALAVDPARRGQMGRAARQRIASIGPWDARVEWVEGVYSSVLAR